MPREQTPLIAKATGFGSNRFKVRIPIRITEEGTLQPLAHKFRKRADRIVLIEVEYPTYQEELDFKRQATRYDKNDHVHWIDTDLLQELRIRRCLKKWDLPESLPELEVGSLHAVQGLLEDDSLAAWQQLPPLLRKAISETIYHHIGSP